MIKNMEELNQEVLNVQELASILRVSKRTVYRYANAGRIPGQTRVGSAGHYRWHKQTIIDWVRGGNA